MEQQGKITWVNNGWAGTVALDASNEQAALASCPETFGWLDEQGRNGWRLVSVVQGTQNSVRMFYFIRER
jgi:hypothetical protein